MLFIPFVVGCAGTSVHPETPLAKSSTTSHATLVVGEITHPRDLTVSAPFYVAMQREMRTQLERSQIAENVTVERDLGASGVGGKAYALRYRVVDDHVLPLMTGNGCYLTLFVTGCFLLVPAFFMGLCTKTFEHRLSVEARVFDVSGAPVTKIQDSSSNEMLNVYDTSTLTPVLRKEYPVAVDITTRYSRTSRRRSSFVTRKRKRPKRFDRSSPPRSRT